MSLKHSRISDDDLGASFTRFAADPLDGFDDIHTGSHPSENDVLAIQPRGLGGAKEELASVGVGSSVGHGKDTGAGVLLDEVFIGELVAVDRLAPGAVAPGEVAALAHESGNNTVES